MYAKYRAHGNTIRFFVVDFFSLTRCLPLQHQIWNNPSRKRKQHATDETKNVVISYVFVRLFRLLCYDDYFFFFVVIVVGVWLLSLCLSIPASVSQRSTLQYNTHGRCVRSTQSNGMCVTLAHMNDCCRMQAKTGWSHRLFHTCSGHWACCSSRSHLIDHRPIGHWATCTDFIVGCFNFAHTFAPISSLNHKSICATFFNCFSTINRPLCASFRCHCCRCQTMATNQFKCIVFVQSCFIVCYESNE